jgi:hypothetical protein
VSAFDKRRSARCPYRARRETALPKPEPDRLPRSPEQCLSWPSRALPDASPFLRLARVCYSKGHCAFLIGKHCPKQLSIALKIISVRSYLGDLSIIFISPLGRQKVDIVAPPGAHAGAGMNCRPDAWPSAGPWAVAAVAQTPPPIPLQHDEPDATLGIQASTALDLGFASASILKTLAYWLRNEQANRAEIQLPPPALPFSTACFAGGRRSAFASLERARIRTP